MERIKPSRKAVLASLAIGVVFMSWGQPAGADDGAPPDSAGGWIIELPTSAPVSGDSGADWLLVQDQDPWFPSIEDAMNRFGHSYDRIGSSQLSTHDFSPYGGIIVPSIQLNAYYDAWADAVVKAKLENYVFNGGTLVVNYAQQSDANTVQWLPGCTTYTFYTTESVTVLDENHPVLTDLTEADLQNWNWATHGGLQNLPPVHNVIVEATGQDPSFVQYPYGLGLVYVTSHTTEWGYWWSTNGGGPNIGPNAQNLLRNQLDLVGAEVGNPVGGMPNYLVGLTC